MFGQLMSGQFVTPMEGGGFTGPDINHEYFPDALLFAGTPFAIDRLTIIMFIMLAVLLAIMVIGASRAKLVPSRGQLVIEMLLTFIRVNISEITIGKERSKPFTPLLTAIFLTIFAMNIAGIIPGLQAAPTAQVAIPLILAVVAWFTFVSAGIKAKGAGRFFKESLFPPGVPWPVYILLTPIEAISTFIVRPATLTIRLMANMISGHLLLVLCFTGTSYLMFAAGALLKPLGALTLAAGIAFFCFEIFVAALQSYIFSILLAVYISEAVSSHH